MAAIVVVTILAAGLLGGTVSILTGARAGRSSMWGGMVVALVMLAGWTLGTRGRDRKKLDLPLWHRLTEEQAATLKQYHQWSRTGRIEQETTLTTMAHLTCVGSSVSELRQIVGEYAAVGVTHVLALRGDPPGGPREPWQAHPEGLDHADQLVSLVRSLGDFTVGVAAFPDKHPESRDLRADAETLLRKADAGASFAITQMVTDVDAYLRLRDLLDRLHCSMPIVPGLLPVTAAGQLQRLTELNGQPLAGDVLTRIEAVSGDDAAVRREGIAICTEHSERLLREGAPGIHFMTMNNSTATLEVLQNLRQLSVV